jgi:hypothetical protein
MGIGDFFLAIWEGLKGIVRKIIEVLKLLFRSVVDWFKKHLKIGQRPVTVKVPPEFEQDIGERLKKPHKVVKVMWDDATQTVAEAEEVDADELDEQMTAYHRNADLVEYEVR